jgi:hypothetical protein
MTESDRVKAAKLCLTMPSGFHEQVDAVVAALAAVRADEQVRVQALRERADAYDDAVRALAEVRGAGPLSTTIGYLIRAGFLVVADPPPTTLDISRNWPTDGSR